MLAWISLSPIPKGYYSNYLLGSFIPARHFKCFHCLLVLLTVEQKRLISFGYQIFLVTVYN